MASMVLGVFDDRMNAEDAIMELERLGYNPKDISIMMRDRHVAESLATDTGASVAGGAVSGAATGGILGGLAGLLIGIGAITVPGIGALLIGGPIAAALGLTGAAATTVSGALTGALAGGLVGALMGLGVSEDDARYYEDKIRAGGILVVVPAHYGMEDEVSQVLTDFSAQQVRVVDQPTTAREEYEEGYQPAYYSEVSSRRHERASRKSRK